MYAAKARKDAQHAATVIFETDNQFVVSRLKQLKKNMVTLYYMISEIIDKINVEKNYLGIESITEMIKNDNKKFLSDVWNYIEKNELEEGLLSELLHFSQAYERSNDAIVDAIEALFLKIK